jgi:hypothetical protein
MSLAKLISFAKKALAEEGWCFFRDSALANDILKTASLFGDPVYQPGVPTVAILKPRERAIARPNSTSELYGYDAFPIHTDMAHWPLPPRYIVMRSSIVVAGLPTMLIDSCDLQLDSFAYEQWCRASWLVSKVRQPYLCSMFFDHEGGRGIRWDVCTMSPYGKTAAAVVLDITATFHRLLESSPIVIDWQSSDDILIVDNWRMLHMRPSIHKAAKDRTLERVLVKEANIG